MARIKILVVELPFAELPRMLRDIIGQLIEAQDDMELVGEARSEDDLIMHVDDTQPDVVVLGVQNAELPDLGLRVFEERPDIKVLGVAGDGRRAYMYELRPVRTPITEVSAAGLLAAIRGAVETRAR